MNPIIDPSTLTEEQRERIRKIWRRRPLDFKAAHEESSVYAMGLAHGCSYTVIEIFGDGILKKGEKHE